MLNILKFLWHCLREHLAQAGTERGGSDLLKWESTKVGFIYQIQRESEYQTSPDLK